MARENPGDVVYERPACGLDERGVPLTPKPIDGGSNVMLLRANRTGVSVRALLEKYGIETSREYKIKSRRGLNSLRSAGAPVPLKLDDGVSPLAALIYNRGDPNATNRSLLDVLREVSHVSPHTQPVLRSACPAAQRVSVKDFGAVGGCIEDSWATAAGLVNCPDDTPAFRAAFKWATEPYNKITISVPPGFYRIDGTITFSSAEMILETGAVLRRISNLTSNTDPIIRLSGTNAVLRGGGTLTTTGPSPRGVVNVGPPTIHSYSNVEFNRVEGVRIQGPGCNVTKDPQLNGSRGLGFDSSESYMKGGSACYQNSARDLLISDFDVGVYLGPDVNGNSLSNISKMVTLS